MVVLYIFHLSFDLSIRVLFGIEFHAVLGRNSGPGYSTLSLRLVPGDLYSACLHRQIFYLNIQYTITLCLCCAMT